MRTFDIKKELFALQELIEQEEFDSETGELIDNSSEVIELAKELDIEIDEKLDNIEYLKREYKAAENALGDEIKRLQERKKMMARNQNKLRLLQDILLSGEKRKTSHFTFYYSKSESLKITDENSIPSDFIRFEKKIDTTALKKALKHGDDIEGAELDEKINLGVR